VAGLLALLVAQGGAAADKSPLKHKPKHHKPQPKPKPLSARQKLGKIKHVVVIYEENHSFDNLIGGWEGVNGRAAATPAKPTRVNQAGTAYTCLLQDDVNLTTPPQDGACTDST